MTQDYSVLEKNYADSIDFFYFKSADLCRRGKYWFVDVENIDGSKITNLRFTLKEDAMRFMVEVYNLYYSNQEDAPVTNNVSPWIFALVTILFIVAYYVFIT